MQDWRRYSKRRISWAYAFTDVVRHRSQRLSRRGKSIDAAQQDASAQMRKSWAFPVVCASGRRLTGNSNDLTAPAAFSGLQLVPSKRQPPRPARPPPAQAHLRRDRRQPIRRRPAGGRGMRHRRHPSPSLRAQRSNPWAMAAASRSLDCFVAHAPRNDGRECMRTQPSLGAQRSNPGAAAASRSHGLLRRCAPRNDGRECIRTQLSLRAQRSNPGVTAAALRSCGLLRLPRCARRPRNDGRRQTAP